MKPGIQILIVFVSILFIPIYFYGNEKSEGLIQKLEASDGLDRVILLNELSMLLVNQNPNKAIVFANEALELAIELQNTDNEALSYFSLAEGYRVLGENLRSLDYYLKSLKTFASIDHSSGVAMSSNQAGRIYRFMGDYSAALDHHLRALKIYTESNDDAGIAKSMIYAGVAYQKLGREDLALDYYNQAIESCLASGDEITIVEAYISKGELHSIDGDYDRALYFYEEALKIIDSKPMHNLDRSGIINNLGNVYRGKGDFDKAIDYYNQALRLSAEIGDKNLIAVIQKNIGITHKLTGDYSLAIEYLNKSRELAEQIRLVGTHKESLEQLSEAYTLSGNYKNALESFKELSRLKETLSQEQITNKISLIQLGYHLKDEAQKQTIREIDLNLKVLRERNIRNIIIFFTLMAIALIFILWTRNKMKMATNIELRHLNTDLEKRVEERTKRLKEENDRRKIAQEHAEQANDAKNRFLANISHEVRTPINAIIGFCDLTIKSGVEKRHELNLQRIKDSSEHLLALIKDILDYSQIDLGHTELKKTSFQLNALLNSVINAFYLDAKSKQIDIIPDIQKNVPQYLIGDKEAIRQIIYNLIGNAIKFTEEGSVKITVKMAEDDPNDGKVRLLFSVKDTGIGISKMKQKLIFMDFAQENDSSNRKYGGAGLGLTISKHFIELMQGNIWVESDKGKGSNFMFTIVLKKDDPNQHLKKEFNKKDEKKLHILIAEDNQLNSHVITAFLSRLGHTSELAGNGKEAIEILCNKAFDAVLMDIEMPEMDGIEATEVIRSGKANVLNSHIPIIALTAHALKDYEEKSLKAGMNSYLTKPVDIEQLSKVLQSL